MNVHCKHYESRTYASGEVVRMCRLDLAPDAPWKCPEGCLKFERRMVDAGWTKGSLVDKPTPPLPPVDAETAALLDAAEDIVNAVGRQTLDDVLVARNANAVPAPWWKRLLRRR